MSKQGSNQFKRALRDARAYNLTDARNTSTLAVVDEEQSTTMVTDPINGLQYVQILPNRRQYDSDQKQLKIFPGYRLVTETTEAPTTTEAPDTPFVNLNQDVTEFLRILNDVGARIAYYIDPDNSDFYTRDLIGPDKSAINSVSSNIIRGVEELKSFFYDFGKKIAPPGVNPYGNDDCMRLNMSNCSTSTASNDYSCSKNINVNCGKDNGIGYEKPPYNPHDLNTFINCLETLAKQTTIRDPTDDYEDYNIKVFQTIITQVKVSRFVDDSIVDEQGNMIRSQPYYNPLHMMLEILKIDAKLFNILYILNLHNTSKSPITGVYYGKARTKINDNGYPVLSDEVTSTDIHNATVQMIDLLSCILKLITFIDIDAYNTIIENYYSIVSIDNNVQPATSIPIVVDPSNTDENVPQFLFGQLLSFCDASRQAVQAVSSLPETYTSSPSYNASKVANIGYNCVYGLMAVSQIIEDLLKSRCFALVMSMIFPSGRFHSAPENQEARDFGPRFNFPRMNDQDLQSITRMAIDGIPLDMSKVVPPTSIPKYYPENDPISINKALYCAIITSLCGISRFLWNSNSPCLRLCDFSDTGAFDPDVIYDVPPEYTTTMPTTTTNISMKHKNKNIPNANKAVRNKNISTAKASSREYTEVDNQPDPQDLFSIQPMIKFLQDNTYSSVLTENDKVFTYLQCYLSAYAIDIRTIYNSSVQAKRSINKPSKTSKNLYSMLTRGVNF
jgi:hypothetical protein